ncbi:hypothetical protein MKY29_03145 [Psychrobacillus sp. FSL K6-2365]|uniref:hypothetical protein n=1 Tax=Psychrobacillus sp. FSL K6-2365 TaxID=2921546 RepID=UPI0030FC09C1
MSEVAVSIEAIDNEIANCEDVMKQWQSKLDKLKEDEGYAVRRLEVLNQVSERLSIGMSKDANQATIDLVRNDLIEIRKGISQENSKISQYTKILDVLLILKEESK